VVKLCSLTMLLLSAPDTARAPEEQADRLVVEGEALGKKRRYRDALERFERAEAIFPRAIHDCWQALCYLRLDRYPRAYLHQERCVERSGGRAPIEWAEGVGVEITERLARGRYAPVDIVADPAGATVEVAALGEISAALPRRLWLPLGRHNLEIAAGGHHQKSVPILLTTRDPYPVQLVLEPLAPPPPPVPTATASLPVIKPAPREPPPPPVVAAAPPPPKGPGVAPWIAFSGALAAVAVGVGFHAAAFAAKDAAVQPGQDYDREIAALERNQTLAWVFYGAGALGAAAGIWLWTDR
jgi:tetratricopeptide (TPR) repeat protein